MSPAIVVLGDRVASAAGVSKKLGPIAVDS